MCELSCHVPAADVLAMRLPWHFVSQLTKVCNEVFPDPRGPTTSIEGRVVTLLLDARYWWMRIGTVSTTITDMMNPSGDGLSRDSSTRKSGCVAAASNIMVEFDMLR